MASTHVTVTVHFERDALELLELGRDVEELLDLAPDWCIEQDKIAEQITQRLQRLITVATRSARGGHKL